MTEDPIYIYMPVGLELPLARFANGLEQQICPMTSKPCNRGCFDDEPHELQEGLRSKLRQLDTQSQLPITTLLGALATSAVIWIIVITTMGELM